MKTLIEKKSWDVVSVLHKILGFTVLPIKLSTKCYQSSDDNMIEFKLPEFSKHEREVRNIDNRRSGNCSGGEHYEQEREDNKYLKHQLMCFLRKAKVKEYQAYLNARTKECTHYYGYTMWDTIYVAKQSLILPSFCGATSIHVIAPHGITVKHKKDENTHNTIYDMDDPDKCDGVVPSFDNVQMPEL